MIAPLNSPDRSVRPPDLLALLHIRPSKEITDEPPPVKPDADDRDRTAKALELRKSGVTYENIAAELGYRDENRPRKAVDRLLGRIEHRGVNEMRWLEVQRLDQLQAAHWDAALRGDVDATKVMLQVIDRRCKLFALNAPMALRVTPEITDAEFAEQVVELIGVISPEGLAEAIRSLPGISGQALLHAYERTSAPENCPGNALHHGNGPDSSETRVDDEFESWSNL